MIGAKICIMINYSGTSITLYTPKKMRNKLSDKFLEDKWLNKKID